MANQQVFLLNAAVQNYAWGKLGSDSAVADLCANGRENFTVEPGEPYAELWMGTHPKAPSVIVNTGQTLSDWLNAHPASVGAKVQERFPGSGQLPFLFKVLSVNKALSIQAHPNKVLAEQLHQSKPDKYPDANHKPEMAIALTQFEGLCGFRPKDEIVNFMKNIPEFRDIINHSLIEKLENSEGEAATGAALQQCFTALMTCDTAIVEEKLAALVHRLSESRSKGDSVDAEIGDLLLRIHDQFPGDVGCFVIYFLNHMILQPGEAMFLKANLPHAYLSGDCMECMACSDNVVRAGLTPKFKDVSTLCSMLNYTCKPAKDNMFGSESHPADCSISVYNPPVHDFAVDKICIHGGIKSYTIPPVDSGSIGLIIQGQAKGRSLSLGDGSLDLCRGSVLFISANEMVDLEITSDDLLMFRAYCPL